VKECGEELLLSGKKGARSKEKGNRHAPKVSSDSLSANNTSVQNHPEISGSGKQYNCDESRICYRNPSWVDIPDTETEDWHGISEIEFYVSGMPDFEGRLVLEVFVAQGK